jgi:chromosome segregation ATPase
VDPSIKKGDLLQTLRVVSSSRKDLLATADKLQARHRELFPKYQTRIEQLQQQADVLARRFRKLYREAAEAYSDADGVLAKQLSIDGRAAQQQCQTLNHEANRLRQELKNTLDEAERSRQKASGLQSEITTCRDRLRFARATLVQGFEDSEVLDNIVIEKLLDAFPQSILSKVARVEHAAEIFEETASKGTRIPAIAETEWRNDGTAIIRIARVRGSSLERSIGKHSDVIAHELGHVVYEGFVDDHLKAEWYALRTHSLSFVSPRAVEDEIEDFAESFRLIMLDPEALAEKDEQRYRFMSDIVETLKS